MKYFIFAIFVLVLLALNIQAERLFFGSGIRLNLLVLPVIFAAVELPDRTYLFFVFTCGSALDFYSSSPFGSFLFSFILLGTLLNGLVKTFWANELNVKSVFVFSAAGLLLGGILALVFAWLLPSHAFEAAVNFPAVMIKLVSVSVFTLAAAIPVFAVWRLLLRLIARIESKKIILSS